jgi:uncharacterized membrane protein
MPWEERATGNADGSAGRRSIWRHRLFRVGVWLKGLDGLVELGGAAALEILGRPGIHDVARFLVRHELGEDPGDPLAHLVLDVAHRMRGDTLRFTVLYLAFHGAVKVWLALFLLRDRLWAFPVALALLGLFLAFQCWELVTGPTVVLGALTVLDFAILALIWREWRALRAAGGLPSGGLPSDG